MILPSQNAGSRGSCLLRDEDDNIYVAGTFEDKMQLDTCILSSKGKKDIFFAKYSPEGKLLWVHSAGGEGEDEVLRMTMDDHVFKLHGAFFKQIHFSSNTLEGIEGDVLFFHASFDEQGKFLEGDVDAGLTGGGNEFYRTFTNDGMIVFNELSSIEQLKGGAIEVHNNFIKEYSRDSKYIIANFYSDNLLRWYLFCENDKGMHILRGIEAPQSARYFIGSFKGTLRVGGVTLTSSGAEDGFIIGVNTKGKVTLARAFGGTKDDAFHFVTVTDDGKIWLTGKTVFTDKNPNNTVPTFFLMRLSCP